MDPNNEVNVLRARFARLIEDGKKVEAFTQLDEWGWFLDTAIWPTIEEYTEKILEGKLSEKEDWMLRGYVNAFRMLADTASGFKQNANQAREAAKKLEEQVKNGV